MTEPTNPNQTDEPKPDETFAWTSDAPPPADAKGSAGTTAASILDSVRDAVDELAERAAPTVRELSARAAELTAIAADRAAPLVKRAGEVTADASGKLASKSREWASDLRASIATAPHEPGSEAAPPSAATADSADPVEDAPASTEHPGPG
jgi:hypothetical protein